MDEMAQSSGIKLSLVCHHLQLLRAKGIVEAERQARRALN